jgi:hypothetical protein
MCTKKRRTRFAVSEVAPAVEAAGSHSLTAADELDNFDFRARVELRCGPRFTLHDGAVELDGDPFRLESQGAQHVFKRAAGGKKMTFPVDRNLILF